MPSSVTGDPLERDLVVLVIQFANSPPPRHPGSVEAHFRNHPYARESPLWLTIDPALTGDDDPTGAIARSRAADFAGVQAELRDRLTDTLSNKGRHAVREALLTRLPPLIERRLQLPGGSMSIPLGRLRLSFKRGNFALEFAPFLTGVQAAIDYGLALLVDTRRDFIRGLMRCAAPLEPDRECGRFFWRAAHSQRYCLPEHAERARLNATKHRVQKWRERR